MPNRNKVVIGGTLGSTDAAQWSVGINFAGTLPGDPVVEGADDLTEWAVTMAGILNLTGGIGPRMASCLTAEGTIRSVTCYYYPDGSATALNVGEATATRVGTGTVRMPAQVSAVCSLKTGISGRSFRGRFYWPAIGETMQDTLSFTAGAAPALAEEFRDFLQFIVDAAPGVAVRPVVYSATRDAVTPVNSVAVGSVPDTQRRRRDNLVEAYSTADYPG